jgi:hypothetical protein
MSARKRINAWLAVLSCLAKTEGFSLFTTLGHTRARIFGPEIGGLIFNSPIDQSALRIDHDQALQSTTHLQYQLPKRLPWFTLTWRYDSGIVSGAVPIPSQPPFPDPQTSNRRSAFIAAARSPPSRIRSQPAPFASRSRTCEYSAAGTANDDKNLRASSPDTCWTSALGQMTCSTRKSSSGRDASLS